MTLENKNEKQWYVDNFKSFEEKLNGEKKLFTHELRKEALQKFENINYPTLKDEEWKYTNISPIIKNNFTPALNFVQDDISKQGIEKCFFTGFDHHRLVFVNGLYSEKLSDIKSLPKGAVIGSLRNAAETHPEIIKKYFSQITSINNAFNALSGAFSLDGAFIYVPEGKVIEMPVQILYLNGNKNYPALSSPRNLIVAGENSRVNIIMNYYGVPDSIYFTNVTTEVNVDDSAVVNIYKVQNENENSFHIEKVDINQGRSTLFNHYSMTFGGAIVRNDINSKLSGGNAECHYYGLYLGRNKQHIDNHTFVDHAMPNCMSNELYKGILDDNSRGVFNGKIMVRQDAQKTNAYQSNKNILLSEKAVIDTKPQLEIFADDVKCSHGATVGHLDDTAYYYIRSRGVPSDLAKSMLIRAFANDVIESINITELKEQLNHMVFEHLHRVEISNQLEN